MFNLCLTFDEVIGTGNDLQGQINPKIENLLKSN